LPEKFLEDIGATCTYECSKVSKDGYERKEQTTVDLRAQLHDAEDLGA
jgi:hypothetical protein